MDQWDLSLTCDDSMTFLNGMFQGIPVFLGEFVRKMSLFILVIVIIDQSQWKQLQVASADSHKSNNIILKLR